MSSQSKHNGEINLRGIHLFRNDSMRQKFVPRRTVLALSLFGGAMGFAPAHADDTADQIRELKTIMLEQQKRIL
jgi:hypothetical protein